MDVWNSTKIDLALQMIGYLAACGLGVIMYSFLRPAKRVNIAAANRAVSAETRPEPRQRPDESTAEFISLGRPSAKAASSRSTSIQSGGRRNRAEVLDLARRMIRAGADEDVIRRTVPVSDGELAMLKNEQSL